MSIPDARSRGRAKRTGSSNAAAGGHVSSASFDRTRNAADDCWTRARILSLLASWSRGGRASASRIGISLCTMQVERARCRRQVMPASSVAGMDVAMHFAAFGRAIKIGHAHAARPMAETSGTRDAESVVYVALPANCADRAAPSKTTLTWRFSLHPSKIDNTDKLFSISNRWPILVRNLEAILCGFAGPGKLQAAARRAERLRSSSASGTSSDMESARRSL